MHNYIENTNKLVIQTGIPTKSIYYFDNSLIGKTYSNFYQFCQENLQLSCERYDIGPAFFFYNNDDTVNAGATSYKGQNILRINKGTLYEFNELFNTKKNSFIDDKALEKYKSLRYISGLPYNQLMFQSCTAFTYFHELAHLIQRPINFDKNIDEIYSENTYSLIKHLTEFDADIHACNKVGAHFLHMWGKAERRYKSIESFEKLASTQLAGVICYLILFFNNFRDEIYYEEYSHPHALIRITYILPAFLDYISYDFPNANQQVIYDEAINISNIVFESYGRLKLADVFKSKLYMKLPEVRDYIKHLILEAEKIEWLVINKIHLQNLR